MYSIFTGPIQVITNAISSIKGNRKIRKPILLGLSGLGTFICFIIIRCWTYVPTYTHLISVGNTFSTDTTDNHFVTAEVEIHAYDGAVVFDSNDDKHKTTRSCVFRFSNKRKDPHIGKPSYVSAEEINKYVGASLVSTNKAAHGIPFEAIGNVSVFCHSFNSGMENNLIEGIPLCLDSLAVSDHQGNRHLTYYIRAFDDNNVLKSADYQYLAKRIERPIYDKNSGRLIHSYICMISDTVECTVPIRQSFDNREFSRMERWIYQIRQILKANDISRCNYAIETISHGVDSIYIRFALHENAEISAGMGRKVGKNYIEIVYDKDIESIKGAHLVTLSAKLMESENTQLIRMFFITSICAACFGFFLKHLIQILMSVRFKAKK